ncbi:MAG: tRNA pseudouridine(55) synthase TruB [Deltaproteobacteria bacterium]|nr:tRNA pseudouridine(55) synthase TruB [Deltaproteobacteria bacterium]MBW2420348.1 tRNA pseudouridine(55) synthase TruB [Deltaproteobacteria bacterium]
MRRRRRTKLQEKPGPAGFLVVDKPPGVTSHDVVDAARKWLGTRRIGHLGTLDPQATGVLPLAVREATKLIPFLDQVPGEPVLKSYKGVVRFGIETDTLDAEGAVTRRYEGALPSKEEVEAALEGFRGEIEQIPPMYSAVKKDGVPLHRLARKGEEVEREPKKVRIHRLELARYEATESELVVDCSPGTYVRVLASELGARLGCGGHLLCLRRLRSGPFDTSHALSAEQLEKEAAEGVIESRLISPADVMGLPVLTLTDDGVRRVLNGGDVSPGARLRVSPGARVLVVDSNERLLAITELRADRRLWPLRVLAVESR